jgi:N-acetyl-gamma-glutamylphosphate reductase
MTEVYPNLTGFTELKCEELDLPAVVKKSDVVFVALPHGHAGPVAREVKKQGKKMVDLGADFRFDKAEVYQKWYGLEHPAPDLLPEAVSTGCRSCTGRPSAKPGWSATPAATRPARFWAWPRRWPPG